MFGWITEKNLKGNIRKNKQRSERLESFLAELIAEVNVDISCCRSQNCVSVNGRGYMLLFHDKRTLWEPYRETVNDMNKQFGENNWTLVCVNYKDDISKDIYTMDSSEFNKIKPSLSIPDGRNYYEIRPDDGLVKSEDMRYFMNSL